MDGDSDWDIAMVSSKAQDIKKLAISMKQQARLIDREVKIGKKKKGKLVY